MRNIITIQHTQAVHHNNGMVGSWTDWELTDLGKEHEENIGRTLSAELNGKTYKIYSSDLIRARQTAEPLARYMGIDIEYNQKLREYNAGEAVGKSGKWYEENAMPTKTFDDRPFPGAESWREFWNRVTGIFSDIVADDAENIILVSHGMTLSVWQQVWRGKKIQKFKYLGLAGGVSFFTLKDNGRRIIQRLNDPSYMEGL